MKVRNWSKKTEAEQCFGAISIFLFHPIPREKDCRFSGLTNHEPPAIR
jgi:hypothetical protein